MSTPQRRVQWMSSKNSSWNNKYCHRVKFNKTSLLTNKKVLRCFLKVASDTVGSQRPGDSLCRWFQATGAQYAKLLFEPIVLLGTNGTTNRPAVEDLSLVRPGTVEVETRWRDRYSGTVPWRHLYESTQSLYVTLSGKLSQIGWIWISWIFVISIFPTFSKSRNPFFSVFWSYKSEWPWKPRSTSGIASTKGTDDLGLRDFDNFFIPCILEVKESVYRSSTMLSCHVQVKLRIFIRLNHQYPRWLTQESEEDLEVSDLQAVQPLPWLISQILFIQNSMKAPTMYVASSSIIRAPSTQWIILFYFKNFVHSISLSKSITGLQISSLEDPNVSNYNQFALLLLPFQEVLFKVLE